jgi:hypothetical protein
VNRGLHPGVCDRFDLTLECIRRHYSQHLYSHVDRPLWDTLDRYSAFFDLFVDFRGYVDFFLLDDLVNDDLSVKFLTEFDRARYDDAFPFPALPRDVETWRDYCRRSTEFFKARNGRMIAWTAKHPPN